jgi:hypothetical protein|tara:strand:+ start:4279 stop:4545 length:267 start_codon:yes stop_codon:yes gene_type:complete
MSKKPEVIQEEIKTRVAKRVPPGDRWSPLDNTTVLLESLTDVLEYVYQKQGNSQFFMDAREGFVYVIDTEEKIIEPEPTKTWSLYGED